METLKAGVAVTAKTDVAPTSGMRSVPAPPLAGTGPFGLHEIVGDVYRIDAILGSGGMGIVYEATDLNLPRRVALKAARHVGFSHAIHTEAQALAAIRHPSFTTLHHYAVHGDIPYFTMERIFGETLEAQIAARREAGRHVSIVEALDTLVTITDALAAAHRTSIAHRDLKPSNILLTGDRVVLIDLGLFIPEPLVGPQNVTAGSLQSIAPEVVLGSVVRGNGPLIDLYALGALAYELLTNAPPFDGDSAANILAKHVSGDIPDIRVRRADVPPQLADLVRELLAKEPFDRPSDSESVLWRLTELRRLEGRYTRTTRPPSEPPRSAR